MAKVTFKVNFNNLKSIMDAERIKQNLERKGYHQVSMKPYGYDKFTIVYEK